MSLLPNLRVWRLANEDTGEEVEGDFEATGLSEGRTGAYANSFALNSDLPITQFLHGNPDTITFTARLYDDSIAPVAVVSNMKLVKAREKLEKLKAWVKKDEARGRPPILTFSAGSGDISMRCVLLGLGAIAYDGLTFTGDLRGVTFTPSLQRFVPFDVDTAATSPPETRYHRARTGDYYELIAEREYQRPLYGDVIRARNPEQRKLSEAAIVKLPSFAAIRSERIQPRSVPLLTLSDSNPSPQRTLRQAHLDRLNRTFTSLIVPEGL